MHRSPVPVAFLDHSPRREEMENGGPAGIEFVLLNNPVARLGDGMGSAVIGDCFLLFSRQVFQKAIAAWFSFRGGQVMVSEDRAAKQPWLTEAEGERLEKERERAEKERERAEKERERAEKERERAEKEQERAARLELERRLAELSGK